MSDRSLAPSSSSSEAADDVGDVSERLSDHLALSSWRRRRRALRRRRFLLIGAVCLASSTALASAAWMPHGSEGLAIRDVSARRVGDSAIVEGEAFNLGDSPMSPPSIRIVLRDKNGLDVARRDVSFPSGTLLSRGESIRFRGEIASPPSYVVEAEVGFIEK